MKKQKGITLVALIITIIVMVILAGVAIVVGTGDSGILNKAELAGEKQVYATVKEKIEAQSEYITGGKNIGKIDLSKTEDNIRSLELDEIKEISPTETLLKITLNDNSVIEISGVNGRTGSDLELLRTYAKGKKTKEIHNGSTFINNDIIPDAEISIKMLDAKLSEEKLDIYVEFRGEEYKIILNLEDLNLENAESLEALGELIVEDVVLGGLIQGNEGKTVIYESDNNPSTTEYWTVITDRDGILEIVSNDVMGSLTLGVGDNSVTVTEDLDGNGTSGDDGDKAIASYNKAIQTINEYCQSIVKTTDNDGVRSIGASDSDGSYSSEFFNNNFKGNKSLVNDENTNYTSDMEKINLYKLHTEGVYFVASRYVRKTTYGYSNGSEKTTEYFGVMQYSKSGVSHSMECWFWTLNEGGGVGATSLTAGVRPIVKNPKNIQYVN